MNLEEHESLIKELASRYPGVVLDGAVDNNCWKSRGLVDKPRILWVLKDTNGDPTPWLKPPNLRALLIKIADDGNPKAFCKKWEKTYGLVVKVSHGLLHEPECLRWDKWAENADGLRKVLHEIAVINIKKEPGKGQASPKELQAAVERYGDIIFTQIKLLDPTIVILGGVKDFLQELLPAKVKSLSLWKGSKDDEGRKWIIAYHPGFIVYHPGKEKENEYYEKIVSAYC